MKICIYGAGAIGGFLAGRLAQAGEDVCLIARGSHGAALRERGLTLISDGQESHYALPCSHDPAAFGPQDAVIVTTKAQSIPAIAEPMKPLLGPETSVLYAINGFPWWYFHKLPGPYEDWQLKSLDAEGLAWRHIGPDRSLGCAVYLAAKIEAPGIIACLEGDADRLLIGDPMRKDNARCEPLADALARGGFNTMLRPDIRHDIWQKLWGNIAFNPISALTHAPMGAIAHDPLVSDLARNIMREAARVADKLGVTFSITLDQRIEKASLLGAHKTSMLQDIEKGRSTELEGIVGAVREVAQRLGIPMPYLDAIYTLVYQKEQFFLKS